MAAVKKLKPAIPAEPKMVSGEASPNVRQRLPELRDGAANALLGVTHSARGNIWRDRLSPGLVNTATAISQQHGLPELLGRVLAARGVTPDDVPVFLDPTIKALMPDPSVFTAMAKATSRLADAVERREPVAIFGDYDVDGACSSALLSRFLSHHGVPARIYIPDRATEGYGPNKTAIGELVREGAKLIVTVDCGTTSFDALGQARTLKTDVVVLDHHQADVTLPDVHAVVNPNRQDDVSGQGHLCAAGVVFVTLVSVARELRRRGVYAKGIAEPNLLNELDLVALATVADVVPLTGLNRAFVTKGLQVMRARENTGLRALNDAAGLNQPPSTYHLGFILGPRINAGGRIGDAGLGARLLTTSDEVEAARIASLLDKLNAERKAIETSMLEEALAGAGRQIDENPNTAIVITGSETWHKGVVGLVASRLVDRFKRPACVIAWEKDGSSGMLTGTGSLRSVAGCDIGGAVRAAVAAGYLAKGGGHAMAAGLTVTQASFEAACNYLTTALSQSAASALQLAGLDIDGALTCGAANNELVGLIERAGPYGQGNPQPRFVFPAHRVKFAKIVGQAHVRCVIEGADGARLDGVAFRAAGQPLGDLLMGSNGMPVHIAGTVKRDTWGGREKIELMIDDAADPRKQ
ncbi:MAG: single-stranded-DNA-specific exonuclease RecJ [Hyphomicrobium sp.]